MDTFDESTVNRDTAGRFDEKPQTAPEAALPGTEMWRSSSYVGVEVPEETVKFERPQSGGYDEIWLAGDGVLRFLRDGRPHRTDGPAIWLADGTYEHRLNGHPVTPPQSDMLLRKVSSAGVQTWESPSGKRTCIRQADGFEEHFSDGDLHRDGGPALVFPGRTNGMWYSHGVLLEDPIPEPPTINPDGVTGSLYQPGQTPKDIAKGVAALIAKGKAAGMFLPGTGVTVQTETPRGGIPVVTMTVTGMSPYRTRDGMLVPEARELAEHARRQLDAFQKVSLTGDPDGPREQVRVFDARVVLA